MLTLIWMTPTVTDGDDDDDIHGVNAEFAG